ncbi:DUF3460 family protein [Massilia sp. DWR3-1-1]|uniref:DUF3460 family protein n=1 Tax=Massilia sp. DWR3-1-1 TaxID=2804559 RepID=UPI003CF379F8
MKSAKLAYRTQGYVSDFEQFLDRFMADHPNVAPGQQRGWHIWWDRPVAQADLVVRRDDAVPVKGYAYK